MKKMLCLGLFVASAACAQEWKPIPRKIPPLGIALDPADRDALSARVAKIDRALDGLGQSGGASREAYRTYEPDIRIFIDAVAQALYYQEFYKKDEATLAHWALDEAEARLAHIDAHPWTKQAGLVVRGYRSSIDGSVQPYGIEIPENADPAKTFVFLHGRGDKTTDLHFIHQRAHKPGKIAPEGAIIIHPFGRHCMGFKSAGEIDVLDVVDHAAEQYGTSKRPVLMGFSMGGAGVWHIGAHYPDRWSAIAPGAGFAETRRYTKLKEEDYPPVYEQTLWGIYDVPNYVRNLFNRPVFAYSGEIDKQKQAADVMAEAYAAEGRELPHLVGPQTAHKYHPETLKQLLGKLDAAHAGDAVPDEVHLQTRTLRYNKAFWVEATGLKEHWQDSRIDATFANGVITARTKNIHSLRFTRPHSSLNLDGQFIEALSDDFLLTNHKGKWIYVRASPRIRKHPGLQGPIDDAFMETFSVVAPRKKSAHEAISAWVAFEHEHFVRRWKSLYRGRVGYVMDEDAHDRNIVLWGDRTSNPYIDRIADQLPIKWGPEGIAVGAQKFDSRHHVLMMIYPNPLDPGHYVVMNSGPTHREGHDRTNSLQNPKLPDWAVVDVREPPSDTAPGKVVAAGFFDENWQLKP